MKVSKTERDLLEKALNTWQEKGILPDEIAGRLKQDLETDKTERQQIAQYFFVIAISCTILAFGSIFIDERLLERLRLYFKLSNIFIAVFTGLMASFWFRYIYKRKTRYSATAFEIYMVLGSLLLLTSLIYFFKDIGAGPSYSHFLIVSSATLFAISIAQGSIMLWIGGILALMGWYGAFSTFHSTDNLFLGMNYPVRFTAFGILILLAALFQSKMKILRFTERYTYIAGLAIFFTGMWGVSVFGNYGHIDDWEKVKQTQVLIYGVILGLLAFVCLYAGIKYKDNPARDFGIIFLLINFYTRYFEYFWDSMNKGIFFLVLALSFGLVGWWLDKRRKETAN